MIKKRRRWPYALIGILLALVIFLTLVYMLLPRGVLDRTHHSSVQDRTDMTLSVGDLRKYINVGGVRRTYLTYVPEQINWATAATDVLIVLHGTGGSGEGIREVGFDAYADQHGFVVVYPDALSPAGVPKWDPTNRRIKDIDFIKAIIEELKIIADGKLGNVYVAGMSNGAVMTQAAACFIETIAGIAPVAAGMGDEMQAYCQVPEPVPYIGFYGTVDRFDELEKYESSVAFFATENGCTETYKSNELPDIDPNDRTRVEFREYLDTTEETCATPVHYYRIEGGGHFWPGADSYRAERVREGAGYITQDIDATKLIVEFFGLDT